MFLKELKLLKLAMPFILGNLIASLIRTAISKELLQLLFFLLIIFLLLVPFRYSLNKKWIANFAIFQSILIFSFISSYTKIDFLNPSFFAKEKAKFHILKIESVTEKEKSYQYIVDIKATVQKKKIKLAVGKSIIYLNKNDVKKPLHLGDLIITKADYSEISKPKNPNQFNYAKFLNYKGINHSFFFKKNTWKKLNKSSFKSMDNWILNSKNKLQNKILKIIANKDAFSVSSALVLGDKNYLSQEIKENFQKTGGMHVLAVSGLHVGLITVLLIFLLRFNKQNQSKSKLVKGILIISGIWVYSLITGLSDSAFRAAIMASLYIFSNVLSRKINSINILLAALIISLFFDPFGLYKVGFQFSYLALLSILIFYKPLSNLFVTKYRLINKFWQLNAISISAQILIAPLSIYYFSIFPIYFLLTNIFAINFASIILYSHCFFFIIEAAESIFISSFYFSKTIAFYINIEIDAFLKILSFIKNIPGSSKSVYINFEELILLYFLILLLSLTYFKKSITIACLAIFISIFYLFHRFNCQKKKFQEIATHVYYLKKGHLIDFKIKDTIYALQSQEFDSIEFQFNILPNRNYNQINNIIQLPFENDYTDKNIYKNDYLIHFQDKNLLIYNKQVPLSWNSKKISIDHALVLDFNPNDLVDIQNIFEPKEYIFFYNKNYNALRKARFFCSESKLNCHFINTNYAKTIYHEKNYSKHLKTIQLQL